MINVIGLIRSRFRREMAERLVPELGPIRIVSIVDSHVTLAAVMTSSQVDVVASGISLAPGLPAFCRMLRPDVRTMLTLVSDSPSAESQAIAADHGFDAVVDLAEGLDHAATVIEREFQRFVCGGVSRPGGHGVEESRFPEPQVGSAIHLAAESDREIVGLIAAGRTDREISAVLHYSGQTIRNRVSKILQSSGLTSRTQLATTYLNIMHNGRNPFIVDQPRARHTATAHRF